MSGSDVPRIIGLVTPLKMMSIDPQNDLELASSMAARKVQTPPGVAQIPFPGTASLASPLSFTVNALGHGTGVGVGVGVGDGVGVGVGTTQPFQFSLSPPASPPQPSTAML